MNNYLYNTADLFRAIWTRAVMVSKRYLEGSGWLIIRKRISNAVRGGEHPTWMDKGSAAEN
jgi:hypothetical protein